MAVILVTHSSGDVTEFCDRAILLEQGRQTYIGDPVEAILRCYISVQPTVNKMEVQEASVTDVIGDNSVFNMPFPRSLHNFFAEVDPEIHAISDSGRLLRFCLTDEQDIPCRDFVQGSRLRLYAQFAIEKTNEIPASSITLWTYSGTAVYCKGTSHYDEIPMPPVV